MMAVSVVVSRAGIDGKEPHGRKSLLLRSVADETDGVRFTTDARRTVLSILRSEEDLAPVCVNDHCASEIDDADIILGPWLYLSYRFREYVNDFELYLYKTEYRHRIDMLHD